jgi:hypothetical protein
MYNGAEEMKILGPEIRHQTIAQVEAMVRQALELVRERAE